MTITITSTQTVQPDLTVDQHTYTLYRFGRNFVNDAIAEVTSALFSGHNAEALCLLPTDATDILGSVTLYYQKVSGSGTTATFSMVKIGVSDGIVDDTDTATTTLNNTNGTYTATITPMSFVGAIGAGGCYAVKISNDNSGNSQWRLLAVQATITSTSVSYTKTV